MSPPLAGQGPNAPQRPRRHKPTSPTSKETVLLCWLFLGWIGVHRMVLGSVAVGGIFSRDPAAERKAWLLEFDLEVVLLRQPRFQHVELESADDADDLRRAVEGHEHLHDALLRHLAERLAELLGAHRVGDANAA